MDSVDQMKTCNGFCSMYPVTERRGKTKPCYAILRSSLLEIHKSFKEYKNGKQARHLINLAEVFNVSMHFEPLQIKSECISIMAPGETYFFQPVDQETPLEEWFDMLLERTRESRSIKILRPVFREEFFEASWDVVVVKKPKLRKDYTRSENLEDLAIKFDGLEGRKRLCICSTAFLLFKMEIKASPSVEHAFDSDTFMEFPINVISNYGKQEKFFFIRLGRCANIGSGELWMATEGGSVATSMHDMISKINQREAEKRRQQGIKLNIQGISNRVLKSQAHRERSKTQQHAQLEKRDSEMRLRSVSNNDAAANSRKNSVTSLETKGPSMSSLTAKHSADGKSHSAASLTSTHSTHSVHSTATTARLDSVSHPPHAPHPLGSIPERVKEELAASEKAPTKKSSFANLMKFKQGSTSSQTMSTTDYLSTVDPNTSKNATSIQMPLHADASHDLVPHLYNFAEDYMSYDAQVDSRKVSAATVGPIPMRQTSVTTGKHSFSEVGTPRIPIPKDYIEMEPTNDAANMPMDKAFPLQEVRSYVSDSAESCYSPGTHLSQSFEGPRAYSLGSRPNSRITQIGRPLEDTTTDVPSTIPEEEGKESFIDLRKRAHSLGSKCFKTSHRKMISKRRQEDELSENGESRSRADSIGSTGQPMSRQNMNRSLMSHPESEDHVEMDFDRNKASSRTSIDSPSNRSRNSSLGVQVSNSIRTALDLALAAHKAKQHAIVSERSQSQEGLSSDYVQFERQSETPKIELDTKPEPKKPLKSLYEDDDYVISSFPENKVPSSASCSRIIETIVESAFSSTSTSPSISAIQSRSGSSAAEEAHLKSNYVESTLPKIENLTLNTNQEKNPHQPLEYAIISPMSTQKSSPMAHMTTQKSDPGPVPMPAPAQAYVSYRTQKSVTYDKPKVQKPLPPVPMQKSQAYIQPQPMPTCDYAMVEASVGVQNPSMVEPTCDYAVVEAPKVAGKT